jgi:hypothetical protein
MMELDNGSSIAISLDEDESGKDFVVCSLGDKNQMRLTPHQARVLATELIMAVNRAEVRGNLKRSHNLSRKSENQNSRDIFPQVFAKQ